MKLEPESIERLLQASQDELYCLLGLYSIGTNYDPVAILQRGRAGLFQSSKANTMAEMGQESRLFRNRCLESFGRNFLRIWAKELQKAICHNGELRRTFKTSDKHKLDLMVAAIVGQIAAHIPGLASASGLLIVLGVFIARTGLDSFCKVLDEMDDHTKEKDES